MRRDLRRAGLALLVLPLVAALLGSRCGNPQPQVQLRFEPASLVVGSGQVVELELVADLGSRQLQAYDVDVAASSAVLAAVGAEAQGDFDDDGALFLPPVFDPATGFLERVVDVRHGTPAATGEVVLARIRVLALAEGDGVVSVAAAGLATPSGQALASAHADAQITVVVP